MNHFIYDEEELVVQKPKQTYGRRRKAGAAPAQAVEKKTMLYFEEKESINDDRYQLQQAGKELKHEQKLDKEELDPSSVSEFEFRIQQKITERRKLMENLGLFKIKEELERLKSHQPRHHTRHHDIDLTRLRRSQRIREKPGGRL